MINIIFGVAALCPAIFLHSYIGYIASLRLLDTVLIANLRAIKLVCPDIEFIAYSDGSSDETLALLAQAADILAVIDSNEGVGKAFGMRRMVGQARGEIIIFTDANVILEPGSVAPLLAYFGDAGVAGTLRYVNADAGSTAQVGGLYWRLEEGFKRAESRVGSIMGADGSIFAMRRALYPEVPPRAGDSAVVGGSLSGVGSAALPTCPAAYAFRPSPISNRQPAGAFWYRVNLRRQKMRLLLRALGIKHC